MESTRAPLAFGERGIPKLNEELTSTMVVTRQKALVTIEDLMHGVEKVHEAVRCGVMKQIIRLLQDSDDTIRYKSVSVLFIMLQHTVGRQAFLKSDGLDKLIKLFSDKSIKIVKIAFTAMKILTEVPHYAREIVTTVMGSTTSSETKT